MRCKAECVVELRLDVIPLLGLTALPKPLRVSSVCMVHAHVHAYAHVHVHVERVPFFWRTVSHVS